MPYEICKNYVHCMYSIFTAQQNKSFVLVATREREISKLSIREDHEFTMKRSNTWRDVDFDFGLEAKSEVEVEVEQFDFDFDFNFGRGLGVGSLGV